MGEAFESVEQSSLMASRDFVPGPGHEAFPFGTGDSTGSGPHSLSSPASHYFWEQDERHRFTRFERALSVAREPEFGEYLDRTSWELGFVPAPGQDSWEDHQALREARLPFEGHLLRFADRKGRDRYLKVSGEPVFDTGQRFRGYRGFAVDVTRELRNERLLELGLKVTRCLGRGADSLEALVSAIQAICESEGWQAGQYWSLDSADDVMRYHVGWHVPDGNIERFIESARGLVFGRGIGLVGAVWQSGEPLWVPDIAADPRRLRKEFVAQTGWRSALLIPVMSQGKPVGVLDFNSRFIPEPDGYLLRVIGELAAQIGTYRERSEVLERLAESEERYASTVELAAIGIAHVGLDGAFIHVNSQLCEMLGYTRDELVGRTVKDVSHPDDAEATDANSAKLRSGEIDSFKAEKRYVRKDGSTIWVRLTVAEKRNVDGKPIYDISIVEDISDRKRAEERVEYLATHDEMTGLPNRSTFTQLLEHAIHLADRYGKHCAVLFIDLDRFKVINDSLGHEAGDTVLKEMAKRFKRCLRASDTVARLGGDEFVALLEDLKSPDEAAGIARHLISAALQPVSINGQECRVTASVGIASYPGDAGNAQSLMNSADLAMYLAKNEGKNTFRFYTDEARGQSTERMAIEGQLTHALDRKEFLLHYQAKVGIKTGEIRGVEALLRWWNPELGAVEPSQFIPVAEDTGIIVPIGKWVMLTACEQSMAWQRAGLPPVRMAVNVSLRQFLAPDLVEDIANVIQTTGVDPDLLELEITESILMRDVDHAVRKLRAIKEMGVRLAIDNFGTGYSSLAQLKQLPIDTLKVDRSFIRELPGNAEDGAITEAIIAMGRTLGVTVVAEGVEAAEQQTFLSSRSCDEMQGFYFSKPAHPARFAALLRQHVPAPRG